MTARKLSETELALLFVLHHGHSITKWSDGFWRWASGSPFKFQDAEVHKLREAGLLEWTAKPDLVISEKGRAELRAHHMIVEQSL